MAIKEGDYSYNTGEIAHFGPVDYTMFVLTLVISCGIGAFYAIMDRKRNTTKDYLLGGQKMHPVPVALSLMVTFMSAMTLLGNPAEVYNYHTMWWWLCGSFLIAMWFVSAAFVPFFYRLKIESVFQYLRMRFNTPISIFGSFLLILQTLLYMAFLLYAPSLALNAVTGLHLWGSVIGMGVVVTFYTTLGGMKAVLWTDTFQAGVIIAGLLAVLIKGSMLEGGFAKAWEIADSRGRVLFDDFNVDPKTRHSVWSMVIGGWGFWMYLYGVNQAQVQRCLSCPSVRRAQMAVWINLPGLIFIVSTCCMIGIVMFAFYVDCHPISYGLVEKTDQLVPLYVMDILGNYPGLPGVFVSCVVSGSLSSLSSGLNALAAVTLRDIMQQSCSGLTNLSEFRSTMTSKGLVFFYGVLAIALAYVVSHLGSVLQAVYTVFGILNGPLLGVFTLGMFFPWANIYGAFSGLLVALIFLFWVGIGAQVHDLKTPLSITTIIGCNVTARTPPIPANKTELDTDDPFIELYRMSYMYYTSLGMVLVWAVGLCVSFATGPTNPKSLDPRLICPVVEELMPCLPKKVKDFFRCGIEHDGKYDVDTNVDFDLSVKEGSRLSNKASEPNINEKPRFDDNPGKNSYETKFSLGSDGDTGKSGRDNPGYIYDYPLTTRL